MSDGLHLALDASAARTLARRAGAVATAAPRHSAERWVAIDTAQGALAQAGVVLLLVRRGRTWTHRALAVPAGTAPGTSDPVEWPAPAGRLDTDGLPDPALRARLTAAAAGAPLGPVGEAAVRRSIWALPGGTALILHRVAPPGNAGVAFLRASLVPSGPDALDCARALVPQAGERLGTLPVEALFHRDPAGRAAAAGPAPRLAQTVPLHPDSTTEAAAMAILRECAAQVRQNVAAVRHGPDPVAVHQLRVGLRRLRAALGLFRDALDAPATVTVAAAARWLGGEVGHLRDLQVMLADVLVPEAAAHPGVPGFDRLARALQDRAEATRTALQALLAGDRAQDLLIDLVRLNDSRPWQVSATGGQARRLGQPVATTAGRALDRRLRKVRRMARDLDTLDVEARHALRKELKKLRYGAEFICLLYPAARTEPYLRRLKALQEVFGTLNDAATAAALLSGPDAPAAGDPDAAHAAGRIIGARMARAEADWQQARRLWQKFDATRPFWRGDPVRTP